MKKFRQIGAIVVIILLLSLYLVCFVSAVSGSEKAQTLFRITLGLTVALPIVLYAFLMFLRMFKNKEERTRKLLEGSLEESQTPPQTRASLGDRENLDSEKSQRSEE